MKEKRVVPYISGTKMGLAFEDGTHVTEAIYPIKNICWFGCTGAISITTEQNSHDIYSQDGKLLLANCKYECVYLSSRKQGLTVHDHDKFEEDLQPVALNKDGEWLYGYCTHDAVMKIAPQFKEANSFYENVAVVQDRNGKFGYINYAGEYVIPCIYDLADRFNNGYAIVANYGRTSVEKHVGMIDRQGNVIIPLEYEELSEMHDDIIAVKKDGKCGYIDKSGKVILPSQLSMLKSKLYDQIFHVYRIISC